MALDQAAAQRLWDDRYRKELENFAFKNKYLHETGDPEDMFQDMAIQVWMKAVNAFDASKTTYAGEDVDRAFNAFFTRILNQFLANQAHHRETGKQQYFQKGRSTEDPMGGEEGGPTLMDRLQDLSEQDKDREAQMDLERMYHALPENLSEPLKYIVEHADRGNFSQIMKEIRERWGWTQTRLFNALIEEPEFVELVTNI